MRIIYAIWYHIQIEEICVYKSCLWTALISKNCKPVWSWSQSSHSAQLGKITSSSSSWHNIPTGREPASTEIYAAIYWELPLTILHVQTVYEGNGLGNFLYEKFLHCNDRELGPSRWNYVIMDQDLLLWTKIFIFTIVMFLEREEKSKDLDSFW